jgi:hypothetical protein
MPQAKDRSSLWHPWLDKHTLRHTPCLYDEIKDMTQDTEQFIATMAEKELYCFVNDIIDETEVDESFLLSSNTQEYVSRTGKIVALRAKNKRKSGFFIPSSVWGHQGLPNHDLIDNINFLFRHFQYEALTPSSLSEKMLRSTLPERTIIYRPNDMLRRTLLEHSHGGRIDEKEVPRRLKKLYSYDLVKAYLYHSRNVVSPFRSAIYHFYSDSSHDDAWMDYQTAWIECNLVAHSESRSHMHPIKINDQGVMRSPVEGEQIHVWLWQEELIDCLQAGYTLLHIEKIYGYREKSQFMQEWSDRLWGALDSCENAEQKNMIKKMMVGLPGRFLKSPMQYHLVHESQGVQEHDEPITRQWSEENGWRVTSPWYLRAEPDLQSAQLTQVGHYIVMSCRQDMYRRMKQEEDLGNEILNSYIDCYTVAEPTKISERVGKELGNFKETIVNEDVVLEQNRIIPKNIDNMRAPGFALQRKDGTRGERRVELWRRYHDEHDIISTQEQNKAPP